MLWTSAAMPVRRQRVVAARRRRAPAARPRRARRCPAAVLFDRDGTLIADVPYNGDPERVEPMPGAREALDRLRAAGVPIARRLQPVRHRPRAARRTTTSPPSTRRMEALLGPLGPLEYCPHGPGRRLRVPQARARADRCAPPRALGVDPRECVVVGDIGADVEAARAAGARGGARADAAHASPRRSPPRPSAAPRPRARPSTCCWRWPGDDATCSPSGSTTTATCCSPARRSARSPRAPTASRCCAARAGARPPSCCPASTRSSCWRAPWIDPEPGAGRLAPTCARSSARLAALEHRPRADLRLLPPEPAADRAAPAPRPRPVDRRDLGRLPRLAARPAPPRRRRRPRGRARARPRRAPPASRCRPATTAACASAGPARVDRRATTSSCTRARPCPRGPGSPSAARSSSQRARPGHRVVVTGGPGERELTALRRRRRAGPTSAAQTTLAELAGVLAGADAIVVGNTGPAHLAAAVGTPVVSLFAPTVPPVRWRPVAGPARAAVRRRPVRRAAARASARSPGTRA